MTMKTSPVSKQKHRSRRSSSKNHSPKPAIRKSSAERRERQQTLNKLREMVGGDENSSQLEIMQHVIDYIWGLRQTLLKPVSSDAVHYYGADSQSDVQSTENMTANKENTEAVRLQLANMLKS